MKANNIDADNNQTVEMEVEVEEHECLFCVTMIEWLRQAWPADHIEELPEFLPRERDQVVKVHSEATDFMPFCGPCSKLFMAIMGQFHVERQQREGKEATPLRARVEQQIVAPKKTIVLPGQPGFKAPGT